MSSYLQQFNYQLIGPEDAPKWVFLHGLMGYGRNWRKIANELGKTNRILLFDQRGHGHSIKPENGYAPEDYAKDLRNILQDLNWHKITLVGHSMGGRNALVFAAQYPELLERLVIVDIGPDSRPDAPQFYQGILDLIPTPFKNKALAQSFFQKEFPDKATRYGIAPSLGTFLLSNLEELPDGSMDWRFLPKAMIDSVTLGRAQDHWHLLRKLTIPTLVIRGENSQDLTRNEFQRMRLSNSCISGVEISGAGHWVHFDQPESFIKELRAFADVARQS